jgi:hypothetical protein
VFLCNLLAACGVAINSLDRFGLLRVAIPGGGSTPLKLLPFSEATFKSTPAPRAVDAIIGSLRAILGLLTPQDCANYVKKCRLCLKLR